MAAVKIDGLAEAVAKELQEYSEDITAAVKASVRSSAKTCVATLRQTSPKDTGDYAKGWKARTAYESDSDIRMQVHNKTHYQKTHLLEDGHAKVGGGLVEARPHIQPAADEASRILEKDVKIRVGNA